MKRVASLYLPNWSIDRIRRAERQHTSPPERAVIGAAELAALKQASDAEQGGKQCDAPRNSGWRPGARWARSEDATGDVRAFDRPLAGKDERAGGGSACWAGETRADVERRIAQMEAHQRPLMREMGRRSEAAEHAFKRLPGDDGGKSTGWPEPGFAELPGAPGGMVAIRFGGEGMRPTSAQRRRDPVAQAERRPQSTSLPSSSAPNRLTAGASIPIVDGIDNAAQAGAGDGPSGPSPTCRDATLREHAATSDTPSCHVAGDRPPLAPLIGSSEAPPAQGETRSNAAARSSATLHHHTGYPGNATSACRTTSHRGTVALRSPITAADPMRAPVQLVGLQANSDRSAAVSADGSSATIEAGPDGVSRPTHGCRSDAAARPAVTTNGDAGGSGHRASARDNTVPKRDLSAAQPVSVAVDPAGSGVRVIGAAPQAAAPPLDDCSTPAVGAARCDVAALRMRSGDRSAAVPDVPCPAIAMASYPGDEPHAGAPRMRERDKVSGRAGSDVARVGVAPLERAATEGGDALADATPLTLRPAIVAIRYPGDGPHPDKPNGGKGIGERRVTNGRVGSNDAGASVLPVAPFFDTGRSTAGTVARVCPADTPAHRDAMPSSTPMHAPLVTVHKVGSRVEVAAACPAARMLGIEAGMALTQVRAATPDVGVRDADPAGDRAILDRLATALARRWSPGVSVSDAPTGVTSGEAGLFIDLTGVAHLHGGERAMAQRIVRLLARLGYGARIGIADTPAAAWALARYDRSAVAVLPPAHGLSPFTDYPVPALRLDAGAAELMRRLGIDRVGQLAAMPRAPLVRRFGRTVATRLDQLIGAVAEPVMSVVPRDPVIVEQRLAEPILTADPIAYWIAQLSQRLAQALAEQGRGARALVLALTRVDGEVQAIRVGFARATRDPLHMLRLLVRRIELIDPGFGIEMVALHVTRDEPLGPEALAGDLEEQVPDLAALVDAIVNRIGASHLWRTCAVESDVPERSVAVAAPLDRVADAGTRLVRDDVRHLDTRSTPHPWHPRWPRPARLLRRPEPIDHVMAELPDSYPRRFRWRGQMHQVVRGDGPERIAGEWWRRAPERQAIRDYFQVEDEAGQRFWLFRRGDGQRPETGDMTWHLHGTFG